MTIKLSIVSSMYNSERYIEEFVRRCREAASAIASTYEIILVNDGSADRSLELARALGEAGDDLVIVDLSRNFGQHRALLEGLRFSRGDRVFLIDADLEEDPAWLARFNALMDETRADMVSGTQAERRGSVFERLVGGAFYSILNRLTRHKIPRNPVTARLLTRRFCTVLGKFDETAMFLPGIISYAGFEHVTTPVSKRRIRPSNYSIRQKVKLAIDAITSFSSAPLRYVFYAGVLLSLAAFAVLFGAALLGPLIGIVPSTGLIILLSIWALGGLIMLALGVIGMYVGRIFDEVKRRPATVVRDVYGRDLSDGAD